MAVQLVAGDTSPVLRVTCTKPDGSVLDLTGAIVRLYWRISKGNGQTRVMTITDANAGIAEYQFQQGDLSAGELVGEVEVTFSDRSIVTSTTTFSATIRMKVCGSSGTSRADLTAVYTGSVTAGLFGYYSSNDAVSKTDSATITTAIAMGVNNGIPNYMQVTGPVSVCCTTVGGKPTVGQDVYLAAASDDTNTGAGKVTPVAPTEGVIAPVGVVEDNRNYDSLKTVVIVIQIRDPIEVT